MKTVAIYTRVSTLHQKEEGYSIGEQEERLQLFAKAHGWTVIEIYSDPGYSGGKLDRPAMQKLIKDTEAHIFDAVLIYKLDRLSRSQKDTLFLIEDVFNPNGVGLISMQENFDTTTSFGKAMIGILSVFAQLERGQITERMTMGRIGRAKAGYYSGGSKPPIGYTYKRAESGEKNTLQVDGYEAAQVREIFHLFLDEDWSFTQIARYMHENYTTRYGDWAFKSTIPNILQDRLYIGEVSFSGVWYPGIHEPIISREVFEATQKKLEKYRKSEAGRHAGNYKGAHLLTGLIQCGKCGSRYFVKTHKHTLKDGSIRYHRRYMCYAASGNNKSRTGTLKCDNISIPVEELDSRIISEVRKLSLNPGLVDSISKKKNQKGPESNTDALRARVKELEKQEDKLIDLYQIGAIDISAVRKRADALKAEKEKLNRSIQEADARNAAPDVTAAEAKEKLKDFNSIFESGSLDDQRALLRALIDKIIIFPDKIEIHWSFSAK